MFKSNLDNPKTYEKLDKHQVYESIISFPKQVSQTWTEISYSSGLNKCSLAENIVISGMGGSALGGRIIQSLGQFILNQPLEVVNNYRLPDYVDEKSLVILSSYSGNTEETISCAKDALKRHAQVFIVSTGGKLSELAKKHNLPSYIFIPQNNPSSQPRLGLGYSITSQLGLLSHCKFIHFSENDMESIVDHLNTLTPSLEKNQPESKNPAKSLAQKLKGRGVVFISANHLTGTAHAVKNMINENAKTFSISFELPELNHHLLEGLMLPRELKNNLHFLMLNSDLYPEIIRTRLEITKDVFTRLGYPVTVIKPDSSQPLLQVYETLYFGEFLSYYLSLLNSIDPGPIPWVDYFKEQLDKQRRRI